MDLNEFRASNGMRAAQCERKGVSPIAVLHDHALSDRSMLPEWLFCKS